MSEVVLAQAAGRRSQSIPIIVVTQSLIPVATARGSAYTQLHELFEQCAKCVKTEEEKNVLSQSLRDAHAKLLQLNSERTGAAEGHTNSHLSR